MKKLVKLSSLFKVSYGVNLELNKLEICDNNSANAIRFVSRSKENNGVSAFVKKLTNITPNPANTISVAAGGTYVLSSFVQSQPYYSGRDVFILEPREPMKKTELMFYCMCITNNRYKYSYGRQANKTLKDLLIPSKKEIPDWVNEIQHINKPSKKKYHNKNIDIKGKKWDWFELQQLFILKKGKRLTKEKMKSGDTNFVSSSDSNNGVTARIDRKPIFKENTVTVNYDGSVGESFYQPKPYWALDSVNVLYPKFNLNVFIGLFIATIIKQEKFRFSYGRKWHLERMKVSEIKLPVNKEGNPDWQFMEDFIKSLPYSKNLE